MGAEAKKLFDEANVLLKDYIRNKKLKATAIVHIWPANSQGELKTCLYDDGVLNIKDLMRSGKGEEEIKIALLKAFGARALNGFEAEKERKDHLPVHESMSTIGG